MIENDGYKIFALGLPVFILITVRSYYDHNFSWMGVLFCVMGICSVYMWIKTSKEIKIRKQHWKEIKEEIYWIK